MTTYTGVQFIGYAIPSIPKQVADIGGPDSPGFVEGRYIGIDPDRVDLDARIALIMHAIRQTVLSGAVDAAESTLKIFVMPEFLLRGRRGAYDTAKFAYFCEEFAKRVGAPAYEGWLFVAGTIVNSTDDYHRGADKGRDLAARVREDLAIALANAWQHSLVTQDAALSTAIFQSLRAYTAYCHANPIYEVTDRAYVVAGGAPDVTYPAGLSVEKKFLSNEDFVLNLYKDAHTEEDEAYPPIDEKAGENKQSAFDDLGIFTIKGIKFGLEVCLDHYKARLRSNRAPDTELVQIQLIASCGMQIMQPSVIACDGGLVFNCDGQYGGLDEQSQPNSADSIWTGTDKTRAHTQLTQVVTPCSGNDLAGAQAVLRRPAATVTTVPVDHSSVMTIYAYGAGEVHVYTSLPVPASCG